MLGYYGATLGERNWQVVELAAKQANKPPIHDRPADLLKPEWQQLRSATLELPGSNGSDEDVLTNAMFPQVAPKFFASRAEGPKNLGKDPAAATDVSAVAPNVPESSGPVRTPISYKVTLNGKTHQVTVAPA
jgi:methylmalonyl-CoA carboxyltransferase 5S subunit